MSQALHTSSTGINAGQSQINVIANNVANINTTAYKSANVTFETLYSRTLSYGSAATSDGGGTNPKQIGLGVKVGGITRDFTSGEFVQTGRSTDLMISGTGFFVVQDSDGKQYFTRDGVFSLDSDGNLVNSSGMKVVGAESLYSTSGSSSTVQVPTNLRADVTGSSDLSSKTLSELNGTTKISTGTIGVTVLNDDGTTAGTYTLTISSTDETVADMISEFNSALSGSGVTVVDNGDGTISFTGKTVKFDSDTTTSNFLAQTGISDGNTTSNVMNYSVTLKDIASYGDGDTIVLSGITIDENGILSATYSDGSVLTKYLDSNGVLQWKYTTADAVVISGSDVSASGSVLSDSNFVIELATMVNQEGLIAKSNNLWEWGADCGEVYYGMAGEMAFGAIESGGYEGSNVEISTELTNLITAQSMIQMNSRVFSVASDVMETLAYLGS